MAMLSARRIARFGSHWIIALISLGPVPPASAQARVDIGWPTFLRADPAELGLRIPVGTPKPGAGKNVQIKTDDDELVVGKVHCEISDHFVVIQPDGRISVVPSKEATITERPFVATSVKDLSAKLAKKFPGFRVQATKHFIYVYNTSALFYQGTSRILESLYPGLFTYCESRQLSVEDPPYPLVVVMFRTRKQWEDYMYGKFEGSNVAAFYDGGSNRVLMYEQSELTDAAPEFALKQIISTVAHEGVHQILHNIGAQQRLSRWPIWISEGVPEYFAPTSVDKSLRWKGAGQVNDLQMTSISEMLKPEPGGGETGTAKAIVEAIVTADRLNADGYAWAWALTHFLGEKKGDAFSKYLAEVSRIGPLETPKAEDRLRTFVDHFGDDLSQLDKELFEYLGNLPYVDPIENLPHYVIMMSYPFGKVMVRAYGVTASKTEVQRSREEMLAKLSPNEKRLATFDVRTFPTRTKALNFTKQWQVK